jgi:hypothetical protein
MPAPQEIKKDELLVVALRYPILWDRHPARPDIMSRARCLHHKKFWDIFLFRSL